MSRVPHGGGRLTADAEVVGLAGTLEAVRRLLDHSLGQAVFLDHTARCRFANREFLAFVGRSEPEVIGLTVSELLGFDIGAFQHQSLPRVLAGQPVRYEGWIDHATIGRRFVEASMALHAPTDGARSGIVLFLRDLTEISISDQRLVEQMAARRAVEAYHAVIVETALDAIIVIDKAGHVVDFNPAAVSIFGYSREAAMGAQIADLIIPPSMRGAHFRGLAAYLESGATRILGRRLKLEAIRADGRQIPIELTITDVTLGEQRLFAAHLRDLTTERAAEAEIERQRDALYQKEKLAAFGSLLAGVAHELNNPLAVVIGQSMMMREKLQAGEGPVPTADLARRSQKIEDAAQRCAKIVRSFLDMARQRKTERRSVHLAQLVEEALDLLSYHLKSAGVTVETQFPEAFAPAWIDSDQIHQVVVNLLVNACQALEGDGQSSRLILIAARHDDHGRAVRLMVSDNGPGIAPAIRSRIFDPYFTTKPAGHGSGIGLAVSRGFVEAHGGTLDLEDSPLGGASFVMRLPLGSPADDQDAVGPVSPPAAAQKAGARLVLIIDDERDIAEMLEELVEQLGFRAVIAESGNAAKRLLEQSTLAPDAILCDMRMPDGDGPAFYDWLKIARPALSGLIGFVTGDTLGPSVGRFLARSGCPMIEKPFTRDEIGHILNLLTKPAA